MKKILTIIILIVAIIAVLHTCSKRKVYNTVINTVKNGYFSDVTLDVTVGEIMETICTNSKWEYTPDTDSGLVLVTYTGNIKGQPVRMMFSIHHFAGSMQFQLAYFSLNGEEAESAYGNTGNDELSMIPFALYKAYRQTTNY